MAFCCMVVSCVEPVVDMFGSVYGTVSDEYTGEPIRGASVMLSPGNLSKMTGSDGQFEFTDLEAGQYKIQVQASGYETNNRSFTIVAGAKTTGDISLKPIKMEGIMELSTSHVDFDTEHSELSFEVSNTGNADLSWNVTDVEADWLTVTPISGKTKPGKSSSVKVKADRAKLTKNETVYFNMNSGGSSESIMVTIKVKPKEPYVSVSPSANVDFGKTENEMDITLTAHYASFDYTASVESCDNGWLTLSKSKGTVPDFEETKRSEIISLVVDRSKMKEEKETCAVVISAGAMVYKIQVSAETDIVYTEPYVEVSPSADIDFGLGEKKVDVTLTAHYDSFEYTAEVKSCDGDWLTLSKLSGTIPDYEKVQRSETISLVVDRSKMKTENESCTVEITAGSQIHKIYVSAEREKIEFALSETEVTLRRGDTYQIAANMEITRCVPDNKYSINVNADGGIVAERIGITEVTVYSGKEKAALMVTVEPEYNMYEVPTFAFGYTINQILNECGSSGVVGDSNQYVYYTEYSRYAEAMFMIYDGTCDYVAMFVQKNKYSEHKSFLAERFVKLNKGTSTAEYYIDTLEEDDARLIIEVYSDNQDHVTVLYSPYYPDYEDNINGGGEGGGDDTGGGNDDGGDTDQTVVQQGLYTYYKFDGDFNDSSENGVNGFGYNSPEFVTGIDGESQAVKFSRTDNSSFVVPEAIVDSRMMTICFWGKNFDDGGIFHVVSSDNNQSIFTLSMSEGMLKFVVTKYNNWYRYDNRTAFMHPSLSDGKWHHIALVSDFDKTTYSTITTTLYVDGQMLDTVTEDANVFSEAETGNQSYGSGIKFIMGGEIALNKNKKLNGTNIVIDNFRVYDTRQLTAKEIKDIYNAKQ